MSNRVFLGDLPESFREADIKDIFCHFDGHISKILLKSSYGFVYFNNPDAASNAVKELENYEWEGKKIRIEMADFPDLQGGNVSRYDLRVKASNVPPGSSWQDIKDWARNAGPVKYVSVKYNFAVIEFKDENGFNNALESLERCQFNGRHLRVSKDEGPQSRSNDAPGGRQNSEEWNGRHNRDNGFRNIENREWDRPRASRSPYRRDRGYDHNQPGYNNGNSYGDRAEYRQRSPDRRFRDEGYYQGQPSDFQRGRPIDNRDIDRRRSPSRDHQRNSRDRYFRDGEFRDRGSAYPSQEDGRFDRREGGRYHNPMPSAPQSHFYGNRPNSHYSNPRR